MCLPLWSEKGPRKVLIRKRLSLGVSEGREVEGEVGNYSILSPELALCSLIIVKNGC